MTAGVRVIGPPLVEKALQTVLMTLGLASRVRLSADPESDGPRAPVLAVDEP